MSGENFMQILMENKYEHITDEANAGFSNMII